MTCPCGDPRHDGLVDGAELYAANAAKDHLATLLPCLDEPGAEVSVGLAFAEHGDHLRRALRESALHDDARFMVHVERLSSWTERDRSRALDRLGPDVVARADLTRRRLQVIGAGIALASPADDGVLALSAAAVTRPGPGQVVVPMLSHPRVRQQLRLASHSDIRAQMGYGGRLYRGQRLAEAEPDEPAEAPATKKQGPEVQAVSVAYRAAQHEAGGKEPSRLTGREARLTEVWENSLWQFYTP